jgi:membrane fusion protein (multidrug efflux system)
MKRKVSPILAISLGLVSLSLPACGRMHAEEKEQASEHHKIVVTSPQAKDVIITQQYVCQIRSQRNIEICALQDGFLEEITVKEGQAVTAGQVLFKIFPVLYEARLAAESAEVERAEIEYNNALMLYNAKPKPVVSIQDVNLAKANLDKAKAKKLQAEAELKFATVTAPFDGIIDRLQKQHGSLIEKKDVLTTLSDNRVMWVYFNVPEARYLEYKARPGANRDSSHLKLVDTHIELVLANGNKFDQTAGDTVTIEGKFNNETGNIPFRADFPNPYGLLRHGQTGKVLIHQTLHNALMIPQQATFEILDKQFVWVVDKDGVVHQREIAIQHEIDDIFVIKQGLDVNDRIVLDGVRQVHEGDKVEPEFRKPEEVMADLKHHAE